MTTSALKAVELGLLKIPTNDHPFKSRNGEEKKFLIDARGAGTNIALRKLIISEMKILTKNLLGIQAICGIAKSGIMWGAWLSWELELPYANVLLDGPRHSGLGRQIEGNIENQKIVLVDNWVRNGVSIKKANKILNDVGAKISGTVVITKMENIELEVDVFPVWELDDLFEAASHLKLVPNGYNFY